MLERKTSFYHSLRKKRTFALLPLVSLQTFALDLFEIFHFPLHSLCIITHIENPLKSIRIFFCGVENVLLLEEGKNYHI